jgi:MYXO-CTERM domain-containing protein
MRNVFWAVLVVGLVPASANAMVVDTNFVEANYVVSADLNGATGLAWAPDGSNRLFVARKDGLILIVENGQLLPTPFATVTPVYTTSECGLVGLAFDTDFLSNHWVYAFVTVSANEQQIIRYTANGDVGVNKTTIVAGLPTRGQNHDGGGLGFGPDGKLYWSIGDNGAGVGANADLTVLAAKVSRANRDGKAPVDNPFHDGSGGPRDFIWARGVRNPFTLRFQPATGLLWLNVVGNNYEQVFVMHKGDNGGWIDQEGNQQPPNIRPTIKYKTNGTDMVALLPTGGAVRSNGVTTFSTMSAHLLRPGEKITIAQVADASFNGTFFVASAPDDMHFTVTQAGPDATSGAGTMTTVGVGGCLTGGEFYDSSLVPASYRGNFFFGDYNSGRILRAAIDPKTNNVISVDQWATTLPHQVDIALGPDGALYYGSNTAARIVRAVYQNPAPGLVVTPLHLWTTERQSGVVNVRLATAPTADVVVTVARSGGDTDISVSAGATLTFTAANWNVPQIATISAAADADAIDDQATIAVSATGLPTETVDVLAHDENALPALPDDAGAPPDAGRDGPAAAVDAPIASGGKDAATGAPDAGASADDVAPNDEAGAATGGAVGSGGAGGSGGTGGSTGPVGDDAAAGGNGGRSASHSSGCSCRLGGGQGGGGVLALLVVGLLVRRRARATIVRRR